MATQPIPPTPQQKTTEGAAKASSKLSLDPGETTIDDKLAFDVELECYEQLRLLTAVVAERLKRHLTGPVQLVSPAGPEPPAQLFFLDNALRMALDVSSVVDIQLANLREAYAGAAATANDGLQTLSEAVQESRQRDLSSLSVLQGMVVPTGVADAAVALLGALKTDTRYFGRQVIIPEQAFALALAHEWEDIAGVTFHYPTLFVPQKTGGSDLLREFVKVLDAVLAERKTASKALSRLLARVSQLDPEDPDLPAAKASLDSARDQFQAAEAVFDNLSSKLTKADDKTGLTQLQLLERAAFVNSIAKGASGRTFYLFAQVVSAGGAFRVWRNFIRMLFWGDGLEHTGGCLITFGLFNDAGRLVASDTIGRRSPYLDSRT